MNEKDGTADAQRVDEIANRFHDLYEAYAPMYGYKTRDESAVPWEEVPGANRDLMRAVVKTLMAEGVCR